MRLDLENLPSDIELLHRLMRDMASVVESRDSEIERLRRLIKQFQRRQFGRRSEQLNPDQLALGLEDLDADAARTEAHQVPPPASDEAAKPRPAFRRVRSIVLEAVFVITRRAIPRRRRRTGFSPRTIHAAVVSIPRPHCSRREIAASWLHRNTRVSPYDCQRYSCKYAGEL